MTILDATAADIPVIRTIAEKTWWPTYSPILTPDQITYMLNAIYSDETLRKVFEIKSQHFIILYDEKGPQGFAAFGPRAEEPWIFKLHKLYVLPENHGKGFGKVLIEDIKRRMRVQGVHLLDLNVNRHNEAKKFYEKIGFTVIREEDVPIGPYWMNDFVMRLDLTGL